MMSAAGELVLAALVLEPTPEREEALRRAARAVDAWDGALVALEAHGVLGLARRNLEQARAELPADVRARLDARAAAMRALDAGFRLTLERFLGEAARSGIEVTLLKGASLALDLYPAGGLRAQADLDLLVRPCDVRAAVAAARRIGLAPPSGAFPAWWYRHAHFHLKLVPADPWQRELELHWQLHPLAQLYTVRFADLWARRREVAVHGQRAWTLDPLDRLLHLVTHLLRHCPLGFVDGETLRAWAADPHAPLRLKWLLDVAAEIERRHASFAVDELARRAAEWNAEADLALALAWLRERLALAAEARTWIERALAALPHADPELRRPPPARERPLPGLDLRPSAALAFPRWVAPSAARFGRLSGNAPLPVLRRAGYAARVLGRGALLLAATPAAWLVARARRAAAQPALPPEEHLALAARVRELARSTPP